MLGTFIQLQQGTQILAVSSYNDLPAPTGASGSTYFVLTSTGSKWVPSWLGGNYKPKGLYVSDGVQWNYVSEFPHQASQAETDSGTSTEVFVSPNTLKNSAQWSTKADASHSHTSSDITDFDNAVSSNQDVSDAVANIHTHSNKIILDQISAEDYNLLTAVTSTGLIFGGRISINTIDNTKFDVEAGYGVIVDNSTYPATKTFVNWNTFTAQSTPYISTDTNTFIAVDNTGNLVLTTALQDYFDVHTVIPLGWLEHLNGTTIERELSEPYYVPDIQLQFNQFLEALGGFNIEGNEVQPNGPNLRLNITAGIVFDNGIGYETHTHAVNVLPTNAISNVQFRYFYRDGAGGWVNTNALVNTIDPNNYDDGSGILQPNSSNRWIIQRVYYYAPFGYLDIYHSQKTYNSKDEALTSLVMDPFEENPYLSYDIPIAAIVVKHNATDLTDPTQAEIRKITSSALGGISNTVGEANDAVNIGLSGVGVYKQKTGITLELKKLNPTHSVIQITDNVAGNSVDFTIQQATSSTSGYLSSTDWNTFNNKQPALGFTPENTSNKAVANGYAPLDASSKLPAVNSRPSNVSYNNVNGILSFTWADGSTQAIDLPIENLLQSASYNSTTQTLTVTTNGGGTIDISLATLVDLPEIVLSQNTDPSSTPTTGQKLFIRQDNGAYWTNLAGVWTGGYLGVTSAEKTTWNNKQNALGFTPEDSANKSTSTAESSSSVKFPVWSAIVSYYTAPQIRSILGITTLSGSNTGDETTSSIQTKRPLKTVNGNSLEGSGNIAIAATTNLSTSQTATQVVINSDTGTDATIPLGNGTNAGVSSNDYTTTEKSKLAGISPGATANSSDATLLNRANHTGTQTSSTISDFQESVEDIIGTKVVAGSNVTITYDDVTGNTTVSASSGGSSAPAGSNKQVQYNNAGTTAGATNVLIDGNDLTLATSSAPTIPPTDHLKHFAKRYGPSGSRVMPAVVGPSGLDYTLQPSLWRQKIALWNAPGNSTTVPGVFGINAFTAVGTATARSVATTNTLTRARRLGYVSAATAASIASQYSTVAQYTLGTGTGVGGFMYSCRFGVSDATLQTPARTFIGLASSVAAPTNVNPNTLVNCVGIGHAENDTNWYIYYGGSTAQTRIDLGASFPINTTTLLDLTLWSPPNQNGVVYYYVEIVGTTTTATGVIGPGTAGVTLPANTTLLAHRAWRTNNTAAVAVGIDISTLYIETDW